MMSICNNSSKAYMYAYLFTHRHEFYRWRYYAGFDQQSRYFGQGELLFSPLEKEQQMKKIRFFCMLYLLFNDTNLILCNIYVTRVEYSWLSIFRLYSVQGGSIDSWTLIYQHWLKEKILWKFTWVNSNLKKMWMNMFKDWLNLHLGIQVGFMTVETILWEKKTYINYLPYLIHYVLLTFGPSCRLLHDYLH